MISSGANGLKDAVGPSKGHGGRGPTSSDGNGPLARGSTGVLILGMLALIIGGCGQCGTGPEEEEEAHDARADTPEPVDIPYDGRIRLVSLELEHDGDRRQLEIGESLEIPANAVLYLETWQRLDDHRVRLVDGADRLVPFDLETGPVATRSGPSVEPGGTWFRLTPGEELREGRSYTVRIEPELAERITDHLGRDYEDLVIELRLMESAEPEEDDEDE